MQKEFKVLRPHLGDRPYAKGETRTADPRKVKHLVGTCLAELDDDTPSSEGSELEKVEKPVADKAEPKKQGETTSKTDGKGGSEKSDASDDAATKKAGKPVANKAEPKQMDKSAPKSDDKGDADEAADGIAD